MPTTNTSAPAVASSITALTAVLSHRQLEPLTPLRADNWESILGKTGLLSKYPHIPTSIRSGYVVGIPDIHRTYAPFNSPSVNTYSAELNRIVAHELQAGRYVGPFSQAELEGIIGPFQSSPLSIIPKTKPNTYRIIQNYSFPRIPTPFVSSINSAIDASDYPCTWGTFTTVSLMLSRLPPGSQGAIRDVAEAYRNIPLAASQWPSTVVRVSNDDQFMVDTSTSFGGKPAPGVYGDTDDAACDIFRSEGMGPVTKWVDDHTFIRILIAFIEEYNRRREGWHRRIATAGGRHHNGGRIWYGGEILPDGRTEEFDEDMFFPIRDLSNNSPRPEKDANFSYNLQDVDEMSARLGIPWQREKDADFAEEFTYTGFVWNIRSQTVALSLAKKDKYLNAIREWQKSRTHTLREVQQLYGKLLHASLVMPAGRAYLTSLEAMLTIFGDRPFMPRTPPTMTPDDLQWWLETLSNPTVARRIPGPIDVIDLSAYSDASSEVGIGIFIRGWWRAWRLLPGWKRDGRDIGWAEAVGFELLIRTIIQVGIAEPHFKVYGNNIGVVEGWWNGRSRNVQVNKVFRHVHAIMADADAVVHSRYVASASNPADGPSRGVFPSTDFLLPAIAIPAALIPLIVSFDAPLSDAESSLRQAGKSLVLRDKPARDDAAVRRARQVFEQDHRNDELTRSELEVWG
ncbi:hypothetical protein A0H81_02563 [Grifola frondosa]|uniref:Uncharacterized protein n=1 Tax=Grifola frondosa TaxID=5627 RepID=A0A1C7MKI8_GRIFR|nr:hypothetical protein A0H81_02563 [Grifola frondosa]